MITKDSVKIKTRAKQKKATTQHAAVPPSRDQIALLAEKYWMERGQPDGSGEQDWLRAESELVGIAS